MVARYPSVGPPCGFSFDEFKAAVGVDQMRRSASYSGNPYQPTGQRPWKTHLMQAREET